jgi:hypothetical protein
MSNGYYRIDYGTELAQRIFGEKVHNVNSVRSRRFGPREFVLAAPIRELLRPIIDELGGPTVAALAGTNAKRIWEIMSDRTTYVHVGIADDLITIVLDDPSLWYSVPELSQRFAVGGSRIEWASESINRFWASASVNGAAIALPGRLAGSKKAVRVASRRFSTKIAKIEEARERLPT